MGREIRRVPPNWEHPKTDRYGDDRYQSKYNKEYHAACREWVKEFNEWEPKSSCQYYWEWAGNPPDEEYYLDYDPDDENLCTWWQCYQTVSEGYPVTPPFATAEELIEYLSTCGDFWEQGRAKKYNRPLEPYSKEAATSFVLGSGWAPSLVIQNGKMMDGITGLNEASTELKTA